MMEMELVLNIILKILMTLLVIVMCYCFVNDIIKYFKQKRYWKVMLGIILISIYLYCEYKVLII